MDTDNKWYNNPENLWHKPIGTLSIAIDIPIMYDAIGKIIEYSGKPPLYICGIPVETWQIGGCY